MAVHAAVVTQSLSAAAGGGLLNYAAALELAGVGVAVGALGIARCAVHILLYISLAA